MTGKVKEMFEKWYVTDFNPKHVKGKQWLIEAFWKMRDEFQQGVYREFFEVNGIFISVDECEGTVIFKARYTGNRYNGCLFTVKDSNYNTAFTQAIETACNILEGK